MAPPVEPAAEAECAETQKAASEMSEVEAQGNGIMSQPIFGCSDADGEGGGKTIPPPPPELFLEADGQSWQLQYQMMVDNPLNYYDMNGEPLSDVQVAEQRGAESSTLEPYLFYGLFNDKTLKLP